MAWLRRSRQEQDDWEFAVVVYEHDGEFVAFCPSMSELPPERASAEEDAVAALADAIARSLSQEREDQLAV